MPAIGAAASLSLSQIQSWDVEHLEEAAQRWSSTAQLWEDSFESIHRGSLNPGGTVWEGEAAEAAQQRTFADLVKVRGLAEVLREASSTARWGASNLQYAQRNALTAIEAAQAAGFTVGEDLSVSDPTPLASLLRGGRQTQAEELAADIATRATALSVLDQEVATKITTITAPLHETSFDETPTDSTDNDIQALDNVGEGNETGTDTGQSQDGFVLGPPTKPKIEWDEDFEYGSRSPGLDDWIDRAKWQAKLAGARALRPDLDDATAMYEHYWDNDGKPIVFDYEEAFREDSAIRANVQAEIARAQRAAEGFVRAGNESFSMTGDAVASPEYPETENWQKAIGGYQQWSSADVRVDGNTVTMEVTVHAEDHYNFNRGDADVTTGIPDNVNGRFTELGWAKPFDSSGSLTRTITWELGDAPTIESGTPQFNPGREDRIDGRGSSFFPQWPSNNRETGRVGWP
ncbi:MAG: hypothetical protein K0U84_07815 [Actinomycetia bacterium]|nr:hypothetical protein [Actinomycetes bacterium]